MQKLSSLTFVETTAAELSHWEMQVADEHQRSLEVILHTLN